MRPRRRIADQLVASILLGLLLARDSAAVPSGSGRTLAVDLDLDDDIDVLFLPPSGATQALLQVAGQLAPAHDLAVPPGEDAAVGDLDLDGDADLVQTASVPPCLAVWRNRWAEQGELRYDPTSLLPASACPAANPLLLDWDLDGDLDLLAAGSGGAPWRAFSNSIRPSGHLTFVKAAAGVSGVLAALPGVSDAVAADLDGDGYPEILAVGPGGPVLLRNLAGAGFTEEAGARGLLPEPARALAASDLDLDGRIDLIVLADGGTRLYRNTGGSFLELGAESGLPALSEPADVAAVDLSFDGFPDVVMTSRGAGGAATLLSQAERDGPRFAPAPPLLATAPGAPLATAVDAQHLALVLAAAAAGGLPAVAAHLAPAPDADCDGLPDPAENLSGLDPLDPGDLELDADADRLPNYLEYRTGLLAHTPATQEIGPDESVAAARVDLDGDDVPASRDNCESKTNAAQADADGDGTGDACDATPEGAIEIGVAEPVMEYQHGVLDDRRYFSDRDRFRQEAEALRGYFYQGAEFRWFPEAAPGLQPVHEVFDGHFHQVLLAAELPTGSEAPVVGYTATAPSVQGLSGLVPLRRFVQPDCGGYVLTTNGKRAAKLRSAGYQELAPLGFVPPFEGQARLRRVYELVATSGDGATRSLFTRYPDLEADVAGYESRGEVFRVFVFPTPKTVPLYRATHPGTRDQLLTIDAKERAAAVAFGYRDEGVLGFVLPAPPPRSPLRFLALQRLRPPGGGYAYTADRVRFEELVAAGYLPEGTEGWVAELTPTPATAGDPACVPTPGATPPLDGARRVVTMLREISDPVERAVTAAGVLNAFCAVSRLGAGAAPATPEEERIAAVLAEADPESRRWALAGAAELADVTAAERAELLGPLAAYDPGACDGPPALLTDFLEIVDKGTFNARLRTHFCPGTGLPYTGSTQPGVDRAERAITLGSDAVPPKTTTGDPVGVPHGLPVIRGIFDAGDENAVTVSKELQEDYEKFRHPPGNRNLASDGYYPFGIETGASCSEGPCPRIDGQICGSELGPEYVADRCYAFPIVRRGKPFSVRGYNFWDPNDALLRLEPLGPGVVIPLPLAENPPPLKGVVPGESPADADAPIVCQPPSPTAVDAAHSQNLATFQVPGTTAEGFYRLAIYNRNGTFLLHGESSLGSIPIPGVECAVGEEKPCGRRTIHVCYRQPDGSVALPLAQNGAPIPACGSGVGSPCTVVDCQEPRDDPASAVDEHSCARDGLDLCPAGTWTRPPRPLSQCRVLSADPAATPRCGETPEWFGSRPVDGRHPIIFVSDEPLFELRVLLTRVHCSEESGFDLFTEDEASVVFLAASESEARQGLNSGLVEELGQTWNGDFDSGDTEDVRPPRVMGQPPKVARDEHVSFGLRLIERDCAGCIILVGAIVITLIVAAAAVAACALLPAPCALLAPKWIGVLIALDALLIGIFTAYVLASGVDDDMGGTYFGGTAREFGPRITAVHLPDFAENPAYQTDPGPLPKSAFPEDDGEVETLLTQPADLAGTALTGFGENIDIEHDGGDTHYDVEFLFERRLCVDPPATAVPPEETVCPSSAPD